MSESRERILFAFIVGIVAIGFGVNCECRCQIDNTQHDRTRALEDSCMTTRFNLESIVDDIHRGEIQREVARDMFDRFIAWNEYRLPRLCFGDQLEHSRIAQCTTDDCVLTTSKYLLARIRFVQR